MSRLKEYQVNLDWKDNLPIRYFNVWALNANRAAHNVLKFFGLNNTGNHFVRDVGKDTSEIVVKTVKSRYKVRPTGKRKGAE